PRQRVFSGRRHDGVHADRCADSRRARRAVSEHRSLPGAARGTSGVASRRGVLMSDRFLDRYGPGAIVTGAAVGLGAAWARELARRGLRVVLVDRDGAALRETGSDIRAGGAGARALELDPARPHAAAGVSPGTAAPHD